MPESVWRLPLEGTNLAVLADCHLRDGGPDLPEALFPRLQDADLIVTLGNMGARSGLDRLQQIAPVMGVRGEDDEPDMRTRHATLVLEGAGYRIGCVFDAHAAGVAATRHPFTAAPGSLARCERLFGGAVDVLLHAGTHRWEEAWFGRKGSALNPGSPTCPEAGIQPTILRLKVTAQGCYGQVIWIR